jgi:hypothetical protein
MGGANARLERSLIAALCHAKETLHFKKQCGPGGPDAIVRAHLKGSGGRPILPYVVVPLALELRASANPYAFLMIPD